MLIPLEFMSKEPVPPTDQFSNRESAVRGVSDPIDEKVMSLMNSLYSAEVSQVEFIQSVERLIVEDKLVFDRLIQFISDEIRYVSKYPNNEARLTAEVVGMMLSRGFFMRVGAKEVPGVAPFALIMRGMVEALRRPPTSKLFRFGIIIVEQVLDRIVKWPQLCGAILQISTVKATYPLYHEYIEKVIVLVPEDKKMLPLLDETEYARVASLCGKIGVPELYPRPIVEKDELEVHEAKISEFKRGGRVGGVVTQPAPVPAQIAPIPASSEATIEQLLCDPSILDSIEISAEWFQEQTATLFNILCIANLDEKVRETRTVLESNKNWINWFAYYLVKNRVCKETNQHGIYLSFIDGVKIAALTDSIVSNTFACLRVLLSAIASANSAATHRSVLKNLGAWLGLITISKNKVLKTKDLDMKQLLLDSFEKGKLTTTLPFVCRVMSSVVDSRIFKPPNPWTNGILAVLAELHDYSNLKTNLIFEIEILFKKLDIQLENVKRTELLSTRTFPDDSQDFGPKPAQAIIPEPVATAPPPTSQLSQLTLQLKQLQANWMSGTASNAAAATASAALVARAPIGGVLRPPPLVSPPAPPPPPPPPAAGLTFADTLSFPNLASLVSIPQSVALFQIQPKLRPLVPLAIERAIREIINAVAERSVTISCLTAREIVLKDFASEADESIVCKSAQLMVGCLAGSLALVTCREPFRTALGNHLKAMLIPGIVVDPNELALIEQVVQVVTAENIELGCILMERAVYERATREVCETVALAVQARRLHREQQGILSSSGGGHYTATPFVDPAYPATPPPPSLTVYREFRDLITRIETSPPPGIGPHPAMLALGSPSGPPQGPPSGPPGPPGLPSGLQVKQILDSFRLQAETCVHGGSLKTLLLASLPELVHQISRNEMLQTLPEIVESQPFQLDSYYGLISLGYQAEWLQFLRKIQSILQADVNELGIVAAWTITNMMTDRFSKLASKCIPLVLPPPVKNSPPDSPDAAIERLQAIARIVGSSVTEEHLFVELSLALLAQAGAPACVMAWVLDMIFTKLNEQTSESEKSAMLYILLGVLRYNLVKESEMDRMLARLLTDHRTISTTGFVVYLLQTFTCRMRMSPLSLWPITTEVIHKMLQRVTAAGPLIPANERGLAAQLDSFSKEMIAVANVSSERIGAYRQLHCLSIRPPEPLPWDIVANQAILPNPPPLAPPQGVSPQISALVKKLLAEFGGITSYTEISPVFGASIWQALKLAGCDLEFAPAAIQAPLPEWVGSLFQCVLDQSVDGGLAFLMFVCCRSDIVIGTPQDARPVDILRCKYIRKLWDVLAGRKMHADQSCVKLLAASLSDALSFRLVESQSYTNAILAHFTKILMLTAPQNVPLLTFGWFELLANRNYLPLVLGLKGQRGWLAFSKLVQLGVSFVAAAVEAAGGQGGPAIGALIDGTVRLFELLNLEFPEFLISEADKFLPDLAWNTHLVNLVLAAIPRSVNVPNPFDTNASSLSVVAVVPNDDVHSVCSLVLAGDLRALTTAVSDHSDSVLNSLFNQLRYPNTQTLLFIKAIEHVFRNAAPNVREQVTRKMLDRLMVKRPHPWGLLVLLNSLIQKPEFAFWNQQFLKTNPDIEKRSRAIAVLCFPEPGTLATGPSALLQKVVESQRKNAK